MKMHISHTRCLGLLLSAWIGSTVSLGFAQSLATPGDTLREATVVSQRLERDTRSHIPLQTLDSTALLRRGVTDVASALRHLSGINVRDYGGAGGLKTVSVRGLGAAHTVVCYDGLPLSDARHGQTDLARFNADRLASLALAVADAPHLLCPVRTLAAATLYLDTPLPQASHRWSGTAALRHGSFGMVNPSLSLARGVGQHAAMAFSGNFYYAHNNYPFSYKNGTQTIEEHRTNSRLQATTLEMDWRHATQRAGQWQAKAYYRNAHQRLPGQVMLYSQKGTERLAEQQAFAQAGWKKGTEKWRFMAAAKWGWQESRYADVDAQYPGGRLQQDYWQREGYLTAGLEREIGNLRLAYAADYLYNSLNSNLQKQNNAHRHTLLQALSAQYSLGSLQLTARLLAHADRNTCQGGEAANDVERLLPSVALSWQMLRGNGRRPYLYARAYYKEMLRVPTFTESYFYHLGAQTLRPELTRQLGAGVSLQGAFGQHIPRLQLSVDGFINRITDRITSVPYNLFVWHTTNMGKVHSGGLDMTGEMQLHVARDHDLFFSVNYSLLHSTDRTNPAERTYGKQPAYLPRHSGGASIAYENPWLNVVVRTSAAGARWSTNEHAPGTHLPAYNEWGCGVYRSVCIRRTTLQLQADIINLFNHQYEVIKRYPMPGRSYRIGASLKF